MKSSDILKQVSKFYQVPFYEIRGASQIQDLCFVRNVYFYLCKKNNQMLDDNLTFCSNYMNRSDSVLHSGHKRISGLIDVGDRVETEVKIIEFMLGIERCKPCAGIQFLTIN